MFQVLVCRLPGQVPETNGSRIPSQVVQALVVDCEHLISVGAEKSASRSGELSGFSRESEQPVARIKAIEIERSILLCRATSSSFRVIDVSSDSTKRSAKSFRANSFMLMKRPQILRGKGAMLFTEGFDTVDLREAKALLDDLSSQTTPL